MENKKLNKKKVVLSLFLAIFIGVFIGLTTAFYHTSQDIPTNIITGNFDIKAQVVDGSLKIKSLGEDDYQGLDVKPNFTCGGTAEIKQGALTLNGVVPGDSVQFAIKVENLGNVKSKFKVTNTTVSKFNVTYDKANLEYEALEAKNDTASDESVVTVTITFDENATLEDVTTDPKQIKFTVEALQYNAQ